MESIDQKSGKQAHELNSEGYIVINVPEYQWQVVYEQVMKRVSSQLKQVRLSEHSVSGVIEQMEDKEFIANFGNKSNRFISSAEGLSFVDWAQEVLISIFPGTRAFCSRVSLNELDENPLLTSNDPDFFYRCVRPGNSDIGPAHRDFDLWEAYAGTNHLPEIPKWAQTRWKVWLPLTGWNVDTALRVIPRSHQEDVPVEKTFRAGKPSARVAREYLTHNEKRLMSPFEGGEKREAILFHDKLVHRAPANTHSETRFSCEMTLFSSFAV